MTTEERRAELRAEDYDRRMKLQRYLREMDDLTGPPPVHPDERAERQRERESTPMPWQTTRGPVMALLP